MYVEMDEYLRYRRKSGEQEFFVVETGLKPVSTKYGHYSPLLWR